MARAGFSLLELLVVVALIVVVAAIGMPIYQDYVATARDGALIAQMRSMSVFQEDVKLRTGSYGAGTFDAGRGIATLTDAIGWEPSGEAGAVFVVTVDGGASWTVTATDPAGRRVCRTFPAGTPCAERAGGN